MEISRRKDLKGVEVVAISGRVSGAEVPRLIAEFQAIGAGAGPAAPPRIVLEVSRLDNLPSAVVGSLLEAIRAIEAASGRLVLAGPQNALTVVLDRLGIGTLVTCFRSVDEAVKALAVPDASNSQ